MAVSQNRFLKWNEIASFNLSQFCVLTVEKAKHYFNPSFQTELKILIITPSKKLILNYSEFCELVQNLCFSGTEHTVRNLTLLVNGELMTIKKKAGFLYEASIKLRKEEVLQLYQLGLGWQMIRNT